MVQLSNENAEIAIVGRCTFGTGIGAVTYGVCEALAQVFPVCVIPTEPHLRDAPTVTLPNGRVLPVCHDPDRIKISFFTDVIWNGVHDYNYALVPPNSLKYTYLIFDSDILPPRWVDLLNNHFDLVVASSRHLVDVARSSGVRSPVTFMPIPLDLSRQLASPPLPRDPSVVRFGSVVAFHPRKGLLTLVKAFLKNYADRQDVKLVLHSNISFGHTYDEVVALAAEAQNIEITLGNLSDDEKNLLIQSFDVFVNFSWGEGYSIGAREALAYGKSLVLSDVGAHKDLAEIPGVTIVPARLKLPGRYPEIDNGVFGCQYAVETDAAAAGLERALAEVRAAGYDQTVRSRRQAGGNFGFGALAPAFAGLIDREIPRFLTPAPAPGHEVSDPFAEAVEKRLGRRANALTSVRREVCSAYDGGFFSIFNAFMSHLVWQQREGRCHGVYPDWDIDRFLARTGDNRVMSFCYGQPGDGNLWVRLFEPLLGASDDDLNDANFLWAHAEEAADRHNGSREPFMTYIYAYNLYKSPEFQAWRRQYHRVFSQYIRPRGELGREIDDFAKLHLARPLMIAAHIRHPSHTVEQPSGKIAHEDAYMAKIEEIVLTKLGRLDGPEWGVFLATDQERVVSRFTERYGNRLAVYRDVRRTTAREDATFNGLPSEEKKREGHQLQHLVAADRGTWSWLMAREVVRDAYAMASCHVMLHVVSNVSTAVSYMNPDIEMVFCEA